jgi:16S rRNA (guanine527-N7)-methyltransferase
VEVGGLFLAMKGAEVAEEVKTSDSALRALGGKVEEVKSYELPSGDKRKLVVIRKVRETPAGFPRQRVNISKNPLT